MLTQNSRSKKREGPAYVSNSSEFNGQLYRLQEDSTFHTSSSQAIRRSYWQVFQLLTPQMQPIAMSPPLELQQSFRVFQNFCPPDRIQLSCLSVGKMSKPVSVVTWPIDVCMLRLLLINIATRPYHFNCSGHCLGLLQKWVNCRG